MIWTKEVEPCGSLREGYLDAITYAGRRVTDVQLAVEESGQPWTPDTAVLLYGNMSPDQCRIYVGTAAEITQKVRPWMRPDMASHVVKQQEDALRQLTSSPGSKRRFVRWVIRGARGDWYNSWLDPRRTD